MMDKKNLFTNNDTDRREDMNYKSEDLQGMNPEDFSSENLGQKTGRELHALQLWLFSENIRIETEKKRLQELQNRYLKDRKIFQDEIDAFNQSMISSRRKLKQDELFFDKKMQILKKGFRDLDIDRQSFEKERETFRKEQKCNKECNAQPKSMKQINGELLFAGVHNSLALKKRYKDLLKIYHPDNIAGDSSVVLYINQEYERLRKQL